MFLRDNHPSGSCYIGENVVAVVTSPLVLPSKCFIDAMSILTTLLDGTNQRVERYSQEHH